MRDSVSSRRKITLLASKGHYAQAQEADEARQRRIEEERRRRQQELKVQQEIEWKAFQDARECCRKDTRLCAAMEEIRLKEALHSRYSELCRAHEEEMQAYSARVEAEEAHRSVTLAPAYMETQAKASRLAAAGRYAEAARLKAMTSYLEGDAHNAAEENKRQLVEGKLREKQKELEKRSLASYRNVLVAQLWAQQGLSEKKRAVEANWQHKASEMAVSHYNQRRALHLPLLDTRGCSKTEQLRVSRGTQLKQKVNGDHYYVPSLCNLYGGLLERE
ncbi:uncharacterized protein Tco025E_07541 [Trypanosoma conorhini]|uniref:Uncharacterized protein n=1 Tax=Trypanosoma conorhini TaxID=83891 RepID=A0A422NMG6_9TRYP|nr:uncharacterized protein Tco025E_07541 [Trypanosoma conorhini]RNF06569.1 hypothetical protein Tco025E_07541 [Trypanosoma conorhini]